MAVYALIIEKNKSLDFNSIEEAVKHLKEVVGMNSDYVDRAIKEEYNKDNESNIHFANGVYLDIRK